MNLPGRPAVYIRQRDLETALHCPVCQEVLDACTHVASRPEATRTPGPGDLVICGGCCTVLLGCLGPGGLALRIASDEERAQAGGAVPLDLLLESARAYRRKHSQ